MFLQICGAWEWSPTCWCLVESRLSLKRADIRSCPTFSNVDTTSISQISHSSATRRLTSFLSCLVRPTKYKDNLPSNPGVYLSVTDPLQRYSASDCLKHPWLKHIGLGFGLRWFIFIIKSKVEFNHFQREGTLDHFGDGLDERNSR